MALLPADDVAVYATQQLFCAVRVCGFVCGFYHHGGQI